MPSISPSKIRKNLAPVFLLSNRVLQLKLISELTGALLQPDLLAIKQPIGWLVLLNRET